MVGVLLLTKGRGRSYFSEIPDLLVTGHVIAEGQRWETRKQRKCLLGHSLRYELKGRGLIANKMSGRAARSKAFSQVAKARRKSRNEGC